MLLDPFLILIAGWIAIRSNENYRDIATVIFIGFAMHAVYSAIILKYLVIDESAHIFLAYMSIQLVSLLVLNRLKATITLKLLVFLNLTYNLLAILHYLRVTYVGEMQFSFYSNYNLIVGSIMVAELLYLLGKGTNVVIYGRKQGLTAYNCISNRFHTGRHSVDADGDMA